MPKESKMPRLDPTVPSVVQVSETAPSSIADSFMMDTSTPAAIDNERFVRRVREDLEDGGPSLALSTIVNRSLQAASDSVFNGSDWGSVSRAKIALENDTKLRELVVNGTQQGNFQDLRQYVKTLRERKTSAPILDSSLVPAKAWEEEYKGNSGRLLVDALHAMNRNRPPKEYNNYVPIIQSSGMGKSRTADEAAKFVFTLPFNLRSDADSTAYPRPHQAVRDFFKPNDIGGFSRHKLEHRYLRFFQELFGLVDTKLSEVGPCGSFEDFALAWHSEFTKEEQVKLYGEVVTKSLKELEADGYREGDYLEDARGEVKVSAQKLIKTIKQKSTSTRLVLSGGTQAEMDDPPMRLVRMILYFDESHELISSLTQDDGAEKRSAYQVLCKSLNSIIDEDIFVIHLSTNSNLSRYSPQQLHFWSLRGDSAGPIASVKLQAPFVELPFDIFATVRENEMKLGEVSEVKHMVKFGRPLFHTMHNAGHTNMVEFATQKLYAKESDVNINGQLAALSIRLLLEFEPLRELAREKEAELVAGHMRVAYSVPQHRLYLRSGSPSEPLLAEASAYIMANLGTNPNDITLRLVAVIPLLEDFLKHGLISKGERGELVGRLILTLAHDKAILSLNQKWGLDSKAAASTILFSKPIGVIEFLEALVSSQYIQSVKDSRPVNVHDGPTLEEAFKGAKLNFTHFVKGGDASIITDEAAWMALARCMAFACANNQRTIDLYIPILLWDENLGRWVVSGIFVQFKNCATAEKVTIDATKLGFFTDAKSGDEEADRRSNTRPYITIVMNMGVQPNPSKRTKKTTPQTPPKSTVPVGLAESTTTPSKVTTETGPNRAQPKRKTKSANVKAVHPRYAINITGCSSNVYGVLSTESKQRLEGMLSAHDVLHEHPRTEEKFHDAVRRLKPFWAKNADSFHWATESRGDEDADEDEGVFVGDADDEESTDDMVVDDD